MGHSIDPKLRMDWKWGSLRSALTLSIFFRSIRSNLIRDEYGTGDTSLSRSAPINRIKHTYVGNLRTAGGTRFNNATCFEVQ
jgi:hypothetical protein